MGPVMFKRDGNRAPTCDQEDGRGAGPAASGAAAAPPASTAVGSTRPTKHTDPFHMRPSRSDGTEVGAAVGGISRAGSHPAPTVRSVHPEALDMQPSDAIEGGLGGPASCAACCTAEG